MEINVYHQQGTQPITVFQIEGRINLGNSDRLQANAQDAYQNGTRYLVLDLSNVESITSAGLRSILVIHKTLAGGESRSSTGDSGKSRHLKLVNPTAEVKKVLTTAGFTEILEIYDSTSEAVASF